MPQSIRLASFVLLASLSAVLGGCSPRATNDTTAQNGRPPVSIDDLEHDENHAHAETYAAAVAELEQMRTQISQAFAANDMEAADEPIHEIGHVLEDVVDLAKKEGFSAAAIAEIDSAVDTLFNAFGRIDDRIHGREGAAYSELQSEIDAAYATLQKHLPANQ